jgi:hypothetical protein
MLYYDVLDEIAGSSEIPNEIHPLFHVNPREAWIEIMIQLIERGVVKNSYSNLQSYSTIWEGMLYTKFSTVN